MERFRLVLIPLLLLLVQFSCSLNGEGNSLVKSKDLSEKDPSNWIDRREKDEKPCGRFGVGCDKGKVVSLTTRIMASRKLLQKESDKKFQAEAVHHLPLPEAIRFDGTQLENASREQQPRSPAASPLPAFVKPPILPETSVARPPPPHANTIPQDKSSPEAHNSKNMLLYSSMGIAASLMLIVVLVFMYRRYNKVVTVKPWATGLSGQLQKAFVTGVPILKRQEIEVACEDFSNIIGSLKDCILYKGTLSSGVEIAVISAVVKSSKDWSKHDEDQFKKKIAILSRVNHKNFVNLLGYCSEEEPFTRMMVFEYAPNGALYEHLHNKEVEGLSWNSRLRIAMGVAYCLDHMHQLSPPVILKSLYSSSIHLTDDYAAKISDMELWSETVSANVESGDLHSSTNQITDQAAIVYKFGLLIFEIISGRIPNGKEWDELSKWDAGFLNGEKTLRDIVDPELKAFKEEEAKKIVDVIRLCVDPDPNGRPKMKVIACQLREITAVNPDGATPKLSPLWWAELEIISTEGN